MKCVPICALPITYVASIVTSSLSNEFKISEVEYIMPRYFVPLTYPIILLPSCQCESFCDSMNLEIKLTPYMVYGIVVFKYIRLPTSLLNNVGSIVDPPSSLLNFKPVITGVGVVLQLDMLNLFKTSLAYFVCDIKIPLSEC